MNKIMSLIVVVILGLVLNGWAIPIVGDTANSTGNLGNFSGSFTYSFTNDTSATIVVNLTNTSPAANGGYLTAFAFNNPNNSITNASLLSTSASFGLIGTPDFNNTIPANPFGDFDVGSSITSSWLGGGRPLSGIAVGNSSTFTFFLTGSGFSSLTTQDFIDELTSSPSGQNYWFAARFRGFDNGGSDKVPGVPVETPPIPEPSTIILLATGIMGLLLFRKKLAK